MWRRCMVARCVAYVQMNCHNGKFSEPVRFAMFGCADESVCGVGGGGGCGEGAGGEFPSWGLMPKRETGAAAFTSMYPSSDGRGTIIAVLDSGVDPAVTGLQRTSTGEIKVIERFDCSGCGDVDTSTTCEVVDGCITGLTGRKLQLPTAWENPKGVWRIGVVHPYILYPPKLKERVQEHRKEFLWDPKHKLALADATREVVDLDNLSRAARPKMSLIESTDDKLFREDTESRLEALMTLEKKFNDVGPSYDCVLFNDGEVWRACVDTSEVGDLSKGVFLGEYSKTHEHKHLTDVDLMTISINVHNNGNILEIVGMCSSHGTHVASIASAYFPDEPEKNGIAPGAQVISLGIGDGRLGSMETGTALVRACIKVMELSKERKIDVINMSYGEHAHWSDSGRIGDLMNEVINKYGVVWVVSAGNHGPALSTVGAPPDIAQTNMIGVGAYVSPMMMIAAYSMRAKLKGTAYSWSSRGPCIDGAMGVSICAPGGAITCVPNFTLRGTQLMNGTSMSAPHVAGAISTLISGLKENNISYSPYSIKRALENSATYIPDVEPFAQGCGLLNVEKAYKLLCEYCEVPERDVRFSVTCGKNNHKGIYFRRGFLDKSREVNCFIEPFFATDFKNPEGLDANFKKINFNLKIVLVCDADWVKAPEYLDLMNVTRSFPVQISPEGLPPGVHCTSIKAYDIKCVAKGPVFQIPITMVQPQPLSVDSSGGPHLSVLSYKFTPGTIQRHFVLVPEHATWAVLKLSSPEKRGRFMIHCVQLIPRMSCKSCEFQKVVPVNPTSDVVLPFQVKGGYILEVAIAKYWAGIETMLLNYSIEFHGIRPDTNSVVIHGAEGLHCVRLRMLRRADCLPQVALKYTTQTIRPTESKVGPLTDRDVIPPSRQIYEMINTYNFCVVKATEITPNIPILSDTLYESEFESQLWMLFDSNKQYITSGDAYPSKYTLKVEKGDYVLKLSVRHERKELLEKLNDTPLLVSHKLPQCLTLDAYSSNALAFTGKKLLGANMPPGVIFPVYFGPLPSDKIGKNVTVGQYMSGHVTFAKDELGKKVDLYNIKYILPELPKKTSNGSATKDKEKNKSDEYAEALKDLKVNWLSKLEGETAQKLYDELLKEYPDHMGTHTAFMQSLDSTTDLRKLPSPNQTVEVSKATCEKIISIADKVIEGIDQEKMLSYYGMKIDSRTDAAKIKTQQEKLRGYLLDAYTKRGVALCKMHLSSDTSNEDIMDKIKQTVIDILKFTELTDSKVIHFSLWHSVVMEQWGRAIKYLNKIAEDHPTSDVEDRLIKVYTALDWQHVATFATSALPQKFPNAYRLF
ncbi:tripeptidyl-peptidase II [Arctopsyche grandis]|uniref:tripeptidyl-peptidase II n=1 Tax=Arctopsyche grandis TaxID=121162 RepID=UPI00406D8EF6